MAKAVNLKAPKAISNGALKESELPTRIKVLNWGESTTLDDPILFDEKSAECFYANQRSIGRSLVPLDFNHNTVKGTQAYEADKEPRAIAAYGVPTVIPGDGLYLDYLRWTPSGEKSARDYADLSPAVVCDDDNRVIGMHSVALTPAGAIEGLSFYSADSMSKLVGFDDKMEHAADCDCDDCKAKKAKLKTACMSAEDDHKSKYGDVDYADTKNHKYPINTEEHVRAAWSYIHMPKNQKGYSPDEVATIKKRISAKAKHYGIELRAESADSAVKKQVNAYVTMPYEEEGIDNMVGEHLEYFRKALGLADDAKPDDVMKFLRAKWEGMEKEDKETLPFKTDGGSVDPQIRNDGPLDAGRAGQPQGIIKYAAELDEKIAKAISGVTETLTKSFEANTKALTAELEVLRTERNQKAKDAETAERNSLIAQASREGKVIPLSADKVQTVDIGILREIVANAKPEVPMEPRGVRALAAGEKKPELAGARQRASEMMTRFFSTQGVQSLGKQNLNPRTMAA